MRLNTGNKIAVSFALCASLLCAACSANHADLTGKSDEQVAEAIKGMNPKITSVALNPTGRGTNIAYVTWLCASSPLTNEKTRIRQFLSSLTQATGNESIEQVQIHLIEAAPADQGGEQVLALTLGWTMEALKNVGWLNIADYQLYEIASIEEVGPMGNQAIHNFCRKGGASSFGEVLCERAGWTEAFGQ